MDGSRRSHRGSSTGGSITAASGSIGSFGGINGVGGVAAYIVAEPLVARSKSMSCDVETLQKEDPSNLARRGKVVKALSLPGFNWTRLWGGEFRVLEKGLDK
jgi:hypothetical protein